MRTISIVMLLSVLLISSNMLWGFMPPVSDPISSDYGPRANMTWFHDGIDYGSPRGTEINPVDGNEEISILGYQMQGSGYGGYGFACVTVDGYYNAWLYGHMFADRNSVTGLPEPAQEGHMEGMWAVNKKTGDSVFCIIHWKDKTNNVAYKGLCSKQGYITYVDDNLVFNEYGDTLFTTTHMYQSYHAGIGPVGTTGYSNGFHLHLGCNYISGNPNESENPLWWVFHPHGTYDIKVISPQSALTKKEIQTNPTGIPFKIYVSTVNRLDLNKVDITLDGKSLTVYDYGGEPRKTPSENSIDSDGQTINGVTYKIQPESNGKDYFVIEGYDFSKLNEGLHKLRIRAFEVEGACQKDFEYSFTIGVLGVISTDPISGQSNVDINKSIKITFSDAIDLATFNSSTVTFNPPLNGSYTTAWNSKHTEVTINITDTEHDLKYDTKYTITLSGEIRDTSGSRLDGDVDGEPGGDYNLYFTTKAPEVLFSLTPSTQAMKRGENRQFQGRFVNRSPRPLSIQLSSPPSIPGSWGWSHQLNQGCVELESNSQMSITDLLTISLGSVVNGKSYPVEVTGEVWSGNDLMRNPAKAKATGILAQQPVNPPNNPGGQGSGGNWSNPPNRPGGDQGLVGRGGDDNWSVSDPHYPSPWLFDDDSPVGLLLEGFYESAGHLLGRYGIATIGVESESLKVLSNYDRRLSDLKVLIVPTGALEDVRNNSLFWQGLEEYVQGGGYLMVLDQLYGDLYSRLPGSPQARGWEEDLSCTGLFTLLQENDPVVHGQSYKQCQYPTDGYFTWLPPGVSKHAIRMLRGGAASAITYHYGQGRVFAAT